MVYGARLESEFRSNPIEGSNPSPSAKRVAFKPGTDESAQDRQGPGLVRLKRTRRSPSDTSPRSCPKRAWRLHRCVGW